MSTINSFNDALDFYPTSSRPSLLSRFGRTVRTYWGALRDALAAMRAYHDLTRRRVPHDTAVRYVLDKHFKA
ncbi:MAG: hypothetical protein K2X43_13295 [Hyphomonadaceae bacterium]|nr:hypothetical protein [Hyphomonadaceae bacterium]